MAERKKKPRAFPPAYPTGAAEKAATAGDAWYVDIDGPRASDGTFDFATAYRVIRNRETGEALACRYLAASEAHDLAASLNSGEPLNRISFGRLNVPGRVKSKGERLSPAEWVEILVERPETRVELERARSTERALSGDDIRELMRFHTRIPGVPPGGVEWLRLPTELPLPPQPESNARPENVNVKKRLDAERKKKEAVAAAAVAKDEADLIEAVSKRLERQFGIRRANASRQNDWRAESRKKRRAK